MTEKKAMEPRSDGVQAFETPLFRALQRWYDRNRRSIPIALSFSAYGAGTTVVLEGIHPAIGVCVLPDQMNVSVSLDGECWDFLMSEDILPIFDGVHWWCDICRNEGRHAPFQSIEALWQDHFFDQLADWIRDVLAPARYAVLHGSHGEGATWVELSREAPCPASSNGTIVLRLNQGRQIDQDASPSGSPLTPHRPRS